MTVSKLTKPTVTNGIEKRTTDTPEKRQRIETQVIRQIYRASWEKERHNGHGRQTQSNDNQQINKTDRDKWERKTHYGQPEKKTKN